MFETFFELDDVFSLQKKNEASYDTEDNLNRSLVHVQRELEKGLIFLDDETHGDEVTIEKIIKDKHEEISQVHIYMPCVSIFMTKLFILKIRFFNIYQIFI